MANVQHAANGVNAQMLTWTSVDVGVEGGSRSQLPFGRKPVHRPWYNTAQSLAQQDPVQQKVLMYKEIHKYM